MEQIEAKGTTMIALPKSTSVKWNSVKWISAHRIHFFQVKNVKMTLFPSEKRENDIFPECTVENCHDSVF